LVIFPEGTTTSNQGIIPFKRGAFESKVSVKPIVIKYLGPFFKPTCEAIDVGACVLIAMSLPYTDL